MPTGGTFKSKNCRLFLYGVPKTYKTTWAIEASLRSGYNVLVLNGDDGVADFMIERLTPEQKARLFIMNCSDKQGLPNFVTVMTKLLKRQWFYWNDTLNHIDMLNWRNDTACDWWIVDPTKLTEDWVIIVDTYTKLVKSTVNTFAQAKSIDLSDAEKTDWDGYGWQGLSLDWMLETQSQFDCHFITIGHATEHEKVEQKKDGRRIYTIRTPEGTWPFSSSRPHSKTIGAKFTDIMFTELQYNLQTDNHEPMLDSRNLPMRLGGCRNLAPGYYKINDVWFSHLTGNQPQNPVNEAIQVYKPGELQDSVKQDLTTPAQSGVITAGPAQGSAIKLV